jgi:hypothetical protein
MKAWLAVLVAGMVASWGWGAEGEGQAAGELAAVQREVEGLAADLELLERLNRLQLKAAQLAELLRLAQEREALGREVLGKRQEVLNALAQVLRQKRQLLLADQVVPKELEERIARLNAELQALAEAEKQRAEGLVGKLRKILSAAQLAILTGRQEARQSAMEMLEWLRQLKAADYEEEAQGAAEELAAPEQGLSAAALKEIFDRARKLTAEEFQRQADGLVEKLLPAYALSPAAEDQLLLDFLSSPRLRPLLQDKLSLQNR